jgi:hypothetical protein
MTIPPGHSIRIRHEIPNNVEKYQKVYCDANILGNDLQNKKAFSGQRPPVRVKAERR